MNIRKISTCVITERVDETKEFYQEILHCRVTFDCGWYCSVRFEGSGEEIQFMTPQKESDKPFRNQGITFNISVDDVDREYKRLKERTEIVVPIADHPWGDRSFVICDPNEVRLYIYSDREVSEEFRDAVKG